MEDQKFVQELAEQQQDTMYNSELTSSPGVQRLRAEGDITVRPDELLHHLWGLLGNDIATTLTPTTALTHHTTTTLTHHTTHHTHP